MSVYIISHNRRYSHTLDETRSNWPLLLNPHRFWSELPEIQTRKRNPKGSRGKRILSTWLLRDFNARITNALAKGLEVSHGLTQLVHGGLPWVLLELAQRLEMLFGLTQDLLGGKSPAQQRSIRCNGDRLGFGRLRRQRLFVVGFGLCHEGSLKFGRRMQCPGRTGTGGYSEVRCAFSADTPRQACRPCSRSLQRERTSGPVPGGL